MSFGGYKHPFLLVIQVDLLGHRVCICSALADNISVFQRKNTLHSYQQCMTDPVPPYSCQWSDIVLYLILQCWILVYCIMVLICISLWLIFVCLFTIWITSFIMCLFKFSVHFYIELILCLKFFMYSGYEHMLCDVISHFLLGCLFNLNDTY